ncbi:hypothetical protein PanWU01x14_311070, partial [Parasponia andersonii]
EMMMLWQELDMFEEEEWKSVNDSIRYKKKVERSRVFIFLVGLNKYLDEVRGRILGQKPLPSNSEAFSEVHLKKSEEPKADMDGSALIARDFDQEGDKRGGKQRPWCDHCRKPWHTLETYWKLHGKPTIWKKNQVVTHGQEEILVHSRLATQVQSSSHPQINFFSLRNI